MREEHRLRRHARYGTGRCPRLPSPAVASGSWSSSVPVPPASTRALRAAREGAQVTLISATELAETSSYWAQGGLAAALAAEDSPELHLEDTMRAGRGAVRQSAARVLVEEAPPAVETSNGWV